jgi:adenosyl cobinamide kinase/adenosyl cobinamide phosphate guanylyltransferase
MLHLVFGAPKSGKSEYAEKLVAGYRGATVYVGTLPQNAYYSEIIQKHQQRRPPAWGLIELIGEPRTDLDLLTTSLACYRNVLLDGLLFYLLRLSVTFKGDLSVFGREALSLLTCSAREGELVVVDPLAQQTHALRGRETLSYVQSLLIRHADTVIHVEKGEVVRTTPEPEIVSVHVSRSCAGRAV